ncbi:probable RNA helicase armi [Leptidea sinapis]|uniref:probable RNA helicase armi n=1 Tax=Leptidea sinapis TaxID=189913 RepID=UPI0021350EF6|nr:probable RNA helicase armi [Leptidea sinapis]
MWSYLISLYNYFTKATNSDDDEENDNREQFLLDNLFDLSIQAESEELCNENIEETQIPRDAVCFQKTGVVSFCEENYVLIDGTLYFDITSCSINLNVNDKILYLCYENTNGSVKVVRILENQGICWDGEDLSDEQCFNVIEHIIIGQVEYRQDRNVFISDSDLKFSLDDVKGVFIPIQGDWLEMKCTIQQKTDELTDVSTKQVVNVLSFNAVRSKIKSAKITEWSGDHGTLDWKIFFSNNTVMNEFNIQVGSKAMVEAIESTQGSLMWRAIKLIILDSEPELQPKEKTEEFSTVNLEDEKMIKMTFPLKFDKININNDDKIELNITNNSDQLYQLNKWIILSKKRDSQVTIKPFISHPQNLYPTQTISFTIKCQPKFLGETKEQLVILFRGFQLKRLIEINVVDDYTPSSSLVVHNGYCKTEENIDKMMKIRKNNEPFIPGVKMRRAANFVSVKIGQYTVPDKIWSAVLGNSEQTIYGNDYGKIISRIQVKLPCLLQELSMTNYNDKMHTLVHMEEIQANINLRVYDIQKAFLIRCNEYLGVEIKGLCERRPSLIVGDRVIVKDMWKENNPQFEGFIHLIKGDLVLIKFNPQFHEIYGGSDVSVEFHLSRTVYRRFHHAINQVISNLGPDVLFPSRLQISPPQVSSDKIENIQWYNEKLNSGQRNTIVNILRGECRPMPYIIFGPPGTGKTVTVVETVLQLLKNIPESRLLIATPSNSASNIITERLIEYREKFSGSTVRLIANYLVSSENIPDKIKPYCATIDIAKENSSKSNHFIKDKMNLNCQKSYIGRHRVTIATCNCVGALYYMGFPKGHFTHILIDEAGQALEPEIMIPLSFTDKNNGQVILAGDPMQLGPVVLSKYCKEFGLDISFLCRLLETFPYQKDFSSFKDGFDGRLVTRLAENYRSVQGILELPSKFFYDCTLIRKFDPDITWMTKLVDATCKVFNISEDRSGGIFVHGIIGRNTRAEDSPSWYNPQEASMVALTTCKLYKDDVKAEEIGIIAPYIAQIKYIRLVFDSMGLPQPKIGTVEEFQGQERPIIIISTVRSTELYLQDDVKHTLGFVQNPKRLNVALTRAQVSLILFCNPHLLCKDHLWKSVIEYAVENNKYMGCHYP